MKRKVLSFVLTITLVLTMAIPVSATEIALDNGKLRFGNGTEASINNKGGLQQPFYFNVSDWRKLTYSTYPLNYAVGVDGATLTDNMLTSLAINTSSITSGSGVATATGELTVGGKLLGISHHYSLGSSSSYIKIVTTIQNKDASSISNVKFWTGTQDDWVGITDGPSKIKGNLVDGSFVELTSSTQQATALKIFSGSESVLFFSTHDSAEMIINEGLGFSNIVNTDPRNSPLTMTGDNSYGMLLPLGTLAAGASASFTWYYAAGTLSEIENIIQEVADAAGQGSVTSITAVSAYLNYQSNVTGSAFALVKLASESAPDQATVLASGTSISITAINTDFPISLTGLSENTQYKVYSVFQDGLNNLTAVDAASFTTLDITAPNNAIGYPTISAITASSANFKYKANEAGSIYTIVRKASESAPNKAAILAGTLNAIAAANTEYSISLSSLLDSTDYVVYSVLKDSPGNSSDITTTSFKTLDTTAPLYSEGYPTISAITANSALFNFKSNETGYVYTLLKLLLDVAPNKATVLASGTAIAVAAATEGATSLEGLTGNTEYIVYSVLEDLSGNSSSVTESAFKTTLTPRRHKTPTIPTPQNTLRFNINMTDSYLITGSGAEVLKPMDVAPILLQDRTLLPIRFVVEPLGGTIVWDQKEKKVTITRGTTTIELWIGSNMAKVNGIEKMIDPENANVKPIIVKPGRTMLPLRFISETLGCKVEWEQLTQKIIVSDW
jgi:hypothetical protein